MAPRTTTSERMVEVKPFQVNLICSCGGVMRPTGQVLTVYPPRYPHRCQECESVTDDPTAAYPYITYVTVDTS